MYQAERGLFELRQDRMLLVRDAEGASTLVAGVEGITHDTLHCMAWAEEPLRLVLSPHRASILGVPNLDEAHVSLLLPGARTPDDVIRLASHVIREMPDLADVRPATDAEWAGLTLARLARLIPAVVAVPVDLERVPGIQERLESGHLLQVTPEQVRAMDSEARVEAVFISEAPVPLATSENARFLLFRDSRGLLEHVAILIGDPAEWTTPVPVRLHSACLTGDLFASLRCDCGEQLARSLAYFADHGGGVLLYLAHEGRSIGLGNKLRAYALQGSGLDTVDADCVLGFGPDERDYGAAVTMLRHLGIEAIRLLTNNPEKVQAMEAAGIQVVARQGLHGTLNRHNLPYVEAKVRRAGHYLEGMLAQKLPRS